MLDHSKEVLALIAGKDRAELQHDRVLELALIRLVEIVGEASAKVNSATQKSILLYLGARSSACATD